MDSRKFDAIVDPAIGTAEGILALAKRNPEAVSLILRGTAGKYLSDAMGKVAGYKGAPIRKMQNLMKNLCPPGQTYPYAPLENGIDNEIEQLVDDLLRYWPLMRTKPAHEMLHRILTLITKHYAIIPPELERKIRHISKADPTFRFPPNLMSQFEEHPSLSQQLSGINEKEYRLQKAVDFLLNLPPQGHA